MSTSQINQLAEAQVFKIIVRRSHAFSHNSQLTHVNIKINQSAAFFLSRHQSFCGWTWSSKVVLYTKQLIVFILPCMPQVFKITVCRSHAFFTKGNEITSTSPINQSASFLFIFSNDVFNTKQLFVFIFPCMPQVFKITV